MEEMVCIIPCQHNVYQDKVVGIIDMEEEVMASARATLDVSTVSRSLSSLIDKKQNNEKQKNNSNSLRDLALRTTNEITQRNSNGSIIDDSNSNDNS